MPRTSSTSAISAGRANAWLVALLIGATLGCSRGDSQQREIMEQCANATAARGSQLVDLVAAVAALERQGELPSQLVRDPIPDERNAFAAVSDALNPSLRIALHEPFEEFFAGEWLEPTADELSAIARLMDNHTGRVDTFREALERGEAWFPLGHQFGFFADPSYLDDTAIACRFELAAAVIALEAGDCKIANDALDRAARWIGWLAVEPRLEPRLVAARLRREWLNVVEVIAAHPSATLAEYERLRATLVGWLSAWPDTEAALVGERAATLHAYEAIRHGLLKDIATSDEQARLATRGFDVTATARTINQSVIDLDLMAYLNATQTVRESLERPFHERVDEHKTAARLLGKSSQIAPLAEEMFLPGIPSDLETIAIDRASCELWAIALSSAGGFRLPEHRINPHSGKPYEIDRQTGTLVVRSGDDEVRDASAQIRTE